MNQVAGFDPGAKIVVRLLRNGQPIERIVWLDNVLTQLLTS